MEKILDAAASLALLPFFAVASVIAGLALIPAFMAATVSAALRA